MKVRNITSNSGNAVANQFIIEGEDANNWIETFQSYDSVIIKKCMHKDAGKTTIYIDQKYWDYSVTTGKYRNQFLGETKKETEKKIKSGEYKLVNLN